MTDPADLLAQLVEADARLSSLEHDTDEARAERDRLLHAAREGGVGWDAITAATGRSRSTIARALRRG